MSSNKKNALGRGLSALLENASTDITTKATSSSEAALAGSISNIAIEKIETNPFQPRTHFEEEALNELAASIKEHGIIQPITLRKMGNDKYQLISGERRFRAAQIAGLKEIPAYIRIANDQSMLEMALVENIQRENLDAIEVAISFKRLMDECNLTQEELSQKVGKNRTTVTNFLRLLKLPALIQVGIRTKQITMGHARALINIEDENKQLEIFKAIIENDLSVRQAEELARESKKESSTDKKNVEKKSKSETPVLSLEHQKIVDDLKHIFNTDIQLVINENGKGKLSFSFSSKEDLQRILDILDA
ncbi:MAG: ParB/RepB/Spo0J family partition protein [Bacteroidia bacterium]